ncbi:MAG: 4-hydroxy-tetrahydrodipicolinate reductase [candidate division WOR-3 bacterium]
MVKVVVVGFGGRMGGEIARLISLENDIELVGGVEAPSHPLIGKPAGSGAVVSELKDLIEMTDVVVDFSVPEAVGKNLLLCADKNKPFITGVTGLSDKELKELKNAGKRIPVVYAPNFSLGVAVLTKISQETAQLLGPDYDIHLIETHHKRKRDAPSGTAKMLVERIKERIGERGIEIFSIRTGDVVGEHRLIFGGPGERLELIHRAETRAAFAFGVIRAIRWVVSQPPGFYSMADILKD